MGKTIEIRLSDAQHAALSKEVEASGLKFFDYCRNKLVREIEIVHVGSVERNGVTPDNGQTYGHSPGAVTPPPDDRISRIEDAVARLTDIVLQGRAQPEPPYEGDEPQATGTREDFDAIMARRLADADARGLTRPQAAPVQELTDDERDYDMVGVRPFRKPGPPAFSALGTSNRITRERV